jgi:beta-lactamase superfamily II metal-dependent hydrolase
LDRPPHPRRGIVARPRMVLRSSSLAQLLLPFVLLLACACRLIPGEDLGGVSPPPSRSLSVSFIDVGQGDAVLVQGGGENYLIDSGRAEEGANVVDFLRGRGVQNKLEGIVVTNPPISQNVCA